MLARVEYYMCNTMMKCTVFSDNIFNDVTIFKEENTTGAVIHAFCQLCTKRPVLYSESKVRLETQHISNHRNKQQRYVKCHHKNLNSQNTKFIV